MKVLHIGQMIGGLNTYIRNIVAYSDGSIEFVTVSGKEDSNAPIEKHGRLLTEYKVDLYREINPVRDFRCLFQVIAIIKKEQPDVIHCHSAKGGIIGRIAGFLTSRRTLYTPHAFSFLSTGSARKRSVFVLIEKWTRFKSILLACSRSEAQLARDVVGYKPGRIKVWSNPVPDASIDQSAPSGLSATEPFICTIGRPSYQKNSLFLLEVIKRAKMDVPQLKLVIVGVGHYSPELDNVKSYIAEHKLEGNVELVPWVDQSIAYEYIRDAYFYISTSLYEGLPLAIAEALALSKPIIASDVVGNRDCVRNGYNGFLVQLDVDLFARKIVELYSNEELRTVFAGNSRRLYETDFDIRKKIKDLEEIYTEKRKDSYEKDDKR